MIVPVYNAEKYLPRCVDSILGQTLTDRELLLVDDGSTDGSGAICEEYAAADQRVRVIHQSIAGPSTARNAGLDACTGEYIAFVDSDDYILLDMYHQMLRTLQQENVAMCICQWQYEQADGRQVVKAENINPEIFGRMRSVKFIEFLYKGSYENEVVGALWNKPGGSIAICTLITIIRQSRSTLPCLILKDFVLCFES